jgi:hypothetical protein
MLALAVLLLTGPQVAAPAEPSEPARFVVLERSLRPPVDARGRPWRVEVLRSDATGPEEVVASANALRDGRWRHAKVPAGSPVRLRVRTEDGDVWWVSPVPFAPEGDGQEPAIDLGMVPVRGVARIGKQRLAGFVTFTDGSGAKVGLVVDADGRFEGALPHDGKWTVRAKSVRAAFEKEMEVEVPRPETTREGKALPPFVDVHFPDLAIRGEVVDEEGNPVEGFTLWIGLAGTAQSVPWTYEGSTFRYDRVALGTTYEFSIRADGLRSPGYWVEVPPDDDPEYVRAVVRKWRPFRGHVVSTAGRPFRDGFGHLSTLPGNGLDRTGIVPRGPRAPFERAVPVEAKHTCVVFFPRDFALHVSRLETEGDDHDVVVRPDGGRLELTTPVDPLRVATLFHDGCAVRLSTLAKSQGATSDRGDEGLEVSFPLVEPGPWSFCLVTPGDLETYVGEAPAFPLCAHGVLEVGGRLELSIPAPP